jgi:hypothetical protein
VLKVRPVNRHPDNWPFASHEPGCVETPACKKGLAPARQPSSETLHEIYGLWSMTLPLMSMAVTDTFCPATFTLR